jgi:hypothetical protein
MPPKTIEKDIEGRKVLLKKVNRKIRGDIDSLARTWTKEQRAESMRMAGYEADQIAETLTELSAMPVDVDKEIIPFWTAVADGAWECLKLHLANPSDAAHIEDLDNQTVVEWLIECWDGLIVLKPKPLPGDEQEAEADDPIAGPNFGPTNPIGGAAPTAT